MLGRISKRAPHPPAPSPSSSSSSSSSFSPSGSFPFNALPNNSVPTTAAPIDAATGRRLDITFNERFLTPAPQPSVIESIWQIRVRRNVQKAQIRNLPKVEKVQYYLENRPRKQKLLDWVGSKRRDLVRTWGTVDAWSGPKAKTSPYAAFKRGDVKLLESGGRTSWEGGVVSERMKRGMIWGMLISMGGLLGWLATEKTRAEGPVEPVDPPKKKKQKAAVVAPEEEEEKRPGVFVWGSNRGDVTDPGSPKDFVKTAARLEALDGRAFRDLQLSNDLGVAVDENGDLIQWGRAYSHSFKPETTLKGQNFVQAAISGDNIICLSKSGKVYIVPASKTQLLTGPKPALTSWIPFWSEVSSVSYTPLSLPEKITHLAAGDDHFVLLTKSGELFTAAATADGNTFGQLGLETAPDAPLFHPYKLSIPNGDKISSIAAGERHSVALTSRGEVYTWGSNAQGQLLQQYADNNFSTPTPTLVPLTKLVPGIKSVQAVYAGGANSFFVAHAGNDDIEVYASGSGMWGQLGNGVWNQIQHRPVRVKVIRGLSEWSERLGGKVQIGLKYLSVGENHVAAVLDNDISGGVGGWDVYVWGCGEAYQLGHGKRNNLNVPTPQNPLGAVGGRVTDLATERFMLQPRRKVEILTASGGRKNVFCEETIVFGGACSAVYDKIVS